MLVLARRLVARLLLASTSEIYGDPEVHPQPESSRRIHGSEIRVAWIFNTYGPRMLLDDGRVANNFIVQALKGQPLTLYGDGSQTRSFCYADDLV